MPDLMPNSQAVKVIIFGEEYSIRGADDPEYIRTVAAYLDKLMHDVASKNRNMPPNRIAVLTALNLAGELFDLKKQYVDSSVALESRALNILEMLDSRFPSE
jgi:cell division protein ZapA